MLVVTIHNSKLKSFMKLLGGNAYLKAQRITIYVNDHCYFYAHYRNTIFALHAYIINIYRYSN